MPAVISKTPASAAGSFGRQNEGHGRRLTAAFEALEAFPALAESRNRVLRLVREDRTSVGDVVAAVESDVALLVTVLRMANRMAGKQKGKVASVPEAVELLTPEGVEQLASRIRVFDFFERIPGWDSAPEQFRLHAVATQSAADRLARELDYPKRDELLTSALLHDIGKLVLVHAYPAYPAQIHGQARTPEERVHRERRELGVDHALVGGVLARRWGLPNSLATAIERHHSDDAEGGAAMVRLADMLAHYGHGQAVDPKALLQAAKALALTPGDAALDDVRAALGQRATASATWIRARSPTARSTCSRSSPRARSTSRSPTSSSCPPARCAPTCTTPTRSSARTIAPRRS